MREIDEKFIENPVFIKWVFNTNPSLEQYWKSYLSEHPEEKEQIIELKSHLTELRFSSQTLSNDEKKALEIQIIKKLNRNLKLNRYRVLANSLLKYAAVALIFMAIGGLLVYLGRENKTSNKRESFQPIAQIPSSLQGPVLITSNGKNIDLKNSKSTVDYTKHGTIVVNNDSIIQTETEPDGGYNQLVIPYGNQSRVVLSDSTVVWLNSGSQLIYSAKFAAKTREVRLQGEAFFAVSKNPAKPFVVNAGGLAIKVLGTQFNVSAYGEDNAVQTVLKEGSVAIRRKGAGLFEREIQLKPNQLASFDKSTNDIKVFECEADNYTLWTKGLIAFEESDYIRIIKKLERYYNISISFSDPNKEIMRISGKLDLTHGRKEVFEYLEKVSLSKFDEKSENEYVIK